MMKHYLVLIVMACFSFSSIAQSHSVLSQGKWFKISTDKAGVYKLSYDDLKQLGVDVNNLKSNSLNLYGLPAGALQESYSPDFNFDLQKIAISVYDNNDGVFNEGDYILFYGEGPVSWSFDKQCRHTTNLYDNKVYYYLKTDDNEPLRIKTVDYSNETATDTINNLIYNELHEKELYNPLHSGRNWLGEKFKDTLERSWSFSYPDFFVKGGKLFINAAAHSTETSYFDVYINNQLVANLKMWKAPNYIYAYRLRDTIIDLPDLGNEFELKIVYNAPDDLSVGWLDYFELQLNTSTGITTEQRNIRSLQSLNENIFYYRLNNAQSQDIVWDITNPMNCNEMTTKYNNNELSFTDIHPAHEFIVFRNSNILKPYLIGNIENQDIIGDEPATMIIITNNELFDAAKLLADFHKSNDDMIVNVYQIDKVYNEFSAGRLDPAAIRNLVALKTKDEESKLKYLLLFGPASFDYRGIKYPDISQVPTYESGNSASAIKSFHTDTYFADLGISKKEYVIGVGRIPAQNVDEANGVIKKIERYYTTKINGNWKNNITLIADNKDYGIHYHQSDAIADTILNNNHNINPDKLYLSLFESTDGTYPQVKQELLEQLSSGLFFVNFIGHSSSTTLTQEKIFTIEDAKNLENIDHLPIWTNFGSESTEFDDPETRSLGSTMILNKNGGAIAFVGNTGLAYSSGNSNIAQRFSQYFFNLNNKYAPIGEAYQYAIETDMSNLTNNWSLIGDPALIPLWPTYNVRTDYLNGIEVDQFSDTVKPGSLLKIQGVITDAEGNQVINFTGKMQVTAYDMPYVKQTIEDEFDPVSDITLYDSILSSNHFEVVNGAFEGEIRLPALYHEQYGNIKLSYYATSDSYDAGGNQNSIMYGGKPSGITEDPVLTSIKVYPTLFSRKITLSFPSQKEKNNWDITLTNVAGSSVYKQIINTSTDGNTTSINLPELPQGMYLLNISSNRGNRVFKLMKE